MTGEITAPAHIQPYVEILGVDGAIAFFLEFGGAEVYLSATPKGRSQLVQHMGAGKAQQLAEAIGHLKVRIPTTKPWIARVWHSRGLPVAEIARRLHMTDVAVRRWLKSGTGNTGPDPRQPSLF